MNSQDNKIKNNISKNLKYYMELKNINNKELAEVLGVSESTVGKWLLKKSTPRMGVIEKLANYFNIEKSDLIEDKTSSNSDPGIIPLKNIVKIPILGHIQCGQPVMTVENYEGYFAADSDLINSDFCLYADGDSMIDVGIYEGDLVFLKSTPQVENGKIAAVLIDDSTTLKRFYKNENQIILQPENKSYSPIIITEEDGKNIKILGEMVGMYSKGSK